MRKGIKIIRDLWVTRGRIAFMVLSLAAGLATFGGVLSMRSVVQREMNRSYMKTVPASATIDIGRKGIDERTMADLRKRTDVKHAIRMAARNGQWRRKNTDDWGRAKIFIFESFENREIVKIGLEKGAHSPTVGTALIERSALQVLGASIGDTFQMRTTGGKTIAIQISGVVYDPALAPAATEQAGYLYISAETFALLEAPILDEIRVLVADNPLDLEQVEKQILSIAAWLKTRDIDIHEIRIPPPGDHPHQKPSNAVLSVFSIFSGLILLLSGILCVSLFTLTMARQKREVAIMKTIGATNFDIILMYTVFLLIVSTMAILLSILPAMGIASLGTSAVADLLNINIESNGAPLWIAFTQAGVGVILPLLAAMPSILGAARSSVRASIGQYGAKLKTRRLCRRNPYKKYRHVTFFNNRQIDAGIRNTFRVPGRTVLTLTLVSVAGALFVMAISVADAWENVTAEVFNTRHYDVELRLNNTPQVEDFNNIEAVKHGEIWGISNVTLASATGFPISRTYPDGGHGSFGLLGVPDQTTLIDFDIIAGRWLKKSDKKTVVLNQLAAARVGENPVGKKIELVVEGRHEIWNVVGVVEEVAAPATAYVTIKDFQTYTGLQPRALRLSTHTKREPLATQKSIREIQRELTAKGISIAGVQPLEILATAMGEHVLLLIQALLVLALMMAFVGILALGSAMSTSVIERSREFGVLRAIGARTSQVRKIVLVEGVLIALMSLPITLFLSIPLSLIVGRIIGQLAFKLNLPLDISWTAMLGWSIGLLLVSAFASWIPARAILKMKTTEALKHV